jgi:hypothetical protein
MGIARSGTHCFFTPSQGIADAIGRRDLRPQSGFAPEDFAPFNFKLSTLDFRFWTSLRLISFTLPLRSLW